MCGAQLQPRVDALHQEILQQAVLHADETPVLMLSRVVPRGAVGRELQTQSRSQIAIAVAIRRSFDRSDHLHERVQTEQRVYSRRRQASLMQ